MLKKILKRIPGLRPLVLRLKSALAATDIRRGVLSFRNPIDAHPIHYRFLPRICRQIIGNRRFLVCDIGANQGVITERILKLSPHVQVLAFEPQRSCLDRLKQLEAKHPNMQLICSGIGSEEGSLTFYEQTNHGLSSFRKINKSYSYGEKGAGGEKESYEAPIITLDDALKEVEYEHLLVKIDTQGYEKEVLVGAQQLLKEQKITAIILELSTCEKYEGQATYLELLNRLESFNFIPFDLEQGHREFPSEMLTEFDAAFVHKNFANKHLSLSV
ncbi:FkbM family methyltransferase [Simkania negevensis]|uniref:FkbM family methyltransferase n=1 Tax=Simkania negevensis TaxID=83561 RepID=A0ABS3AQ34_9BACT|nr:FkbM family methyltransferase [Simkania negevensis]